MTRSKPEEIAARIRNLISGDGGDLAAAARRLGVSEASLRKSTDSVSPEPTLDVILALVQVFGVDPCYLVTGEYDPEVHRQALETACWDGEITPIVQAIRGLPTPEWADEQPRLRLVR